MNTLENEVDGLREVIDRVAKAWLSLNPGIAFDGDAGDAMAAAVAEIEQLRSECLRLSHAEAEAMSVVLSQEGQIEQLQLIVETRGEKIRDLAEELDACTACMKRADADIEWLRQETLVQSEYIETLENDIIYYKNLLKAAKVPDWIIIRRYTIV